MTFNDTSVGNHECSKNIFFLQKWVKMFWLDFISYFKSTKYVASINSYILLCMCLWHTYEISSRSVRWLFFKNTPEWQMVAPVRKHEGYLTLKSIVLIYSSIDLAHLFCNILLINSINFCTIFWSQMASNLFQWILFFMP